MRKTNASRDSIRVSLPVNLTQTLTITDLSRNGSGVARTLEGQVVFIPFALPGEEVEVQIESGTKNYLQGRLLKVLNPSSDRTQPQCAHFQECGGCQLQHLSYPKQFELKVKAALHALKRAQIPVPADSEIEYLAAKTPYRYRNRAQVRVHPKEKHWGYYKPGSRDFLPIQNCPILRDEIQDQLKEIPTHISELSPTLQNQPELKLELDWTQDHGVRFAWNRPHGAFGFRQVNDEQNEHLQKWVEKNLPQADELWDLFGGSGNLSKSSFDRYPQIQIVDSFIPKDVHFPKQVIATRKPVHSFLETLKCDKNLKKAVILDPPRIGLSPFGRAIAKALKHHHAETVLLISCDVDAFVKDLRALLSEGYALNRLGFLDLFPQTEHIESLAVLRLGS